MTGRFPDHFSGHAEEYARHRPDYPDALADLLAGAAPARRMAWDVGCGSGQLSRLLAGRFEWVVATDASGPQLQRAPRNPRVSYRRELADRSSLPAGVADLITVAQAAHWFDLEPFYREVRRVARPGGVIALITYNLPRVSPEVDRVVDGFSRQLSDHWPPERAHVDEAYASLPFPFERIDAPDLYMETRWAPADMIAYIRTWSGVRQLLAAGGSSRLAAAEETLQRAWAGAEERPARWPLRIRLGRH